MEEQSKSLGVESARRICHIENDLLLRAAVLALRMMPALGQSNGSGGSSSGGASTGRQRRLFVECTNARAGTMESQIKSWTGPSPRDRGTGCRSGDAPVSIQES